MKADFERAAAKLGDHSPRARSAASPSQPLLDLQRANGNAAVERLLRPLRGKPLAQPERACLERAFGADLGSLRVETDAPEPAAAGARALTTGSRIAFAPGAFAPSTPEGFRLLAHETAHVLQQDRATRIDPAAPAAPAELEAWHAADAAVTGDAAPVSGGQAVPPAQAADAVPFSPLAPRPFAIEMEWAPREGASELGYERNPERFWKKYLDTYPEHLSAENRQQITGKPFAAPVVDETWVKYYPQDAGFMKDKLEHHHTGQGSRAVGMPSKLHDAYTAVHPQAREVATPGGKQKPMPPQPTHPEVEKEIARHTKEGRMGTEFPPGKPPPPAPDVPAASGVMSVPPGERRPIDPSGKQVIGSKTYPGERAIGETRYPPAKYTPPAAQGTAQQQPPLPPPSAAAEQDWSQVHPGNEPSPLATTLESAPKRGGKPVQLGRPEPQPAAPTPAPVGETPAEVTAKPPPKAPPATVVAEGEAPAYTAKAPLATVVAEGEAAAAAKPRARPQIGLTSPAIEEIQVGRARAAGAAIGLGAGLLAGWALGKYKAWMEEAVAAMPPPKVDAGPMRDYLRRTTGSMRILDLMSKDIGGFGAAVDDAKQSVLGRATAATLLLSKSGRSASERIQALSEIQDYVGALENELISARDGVEAALQLEPEGEERAAAATSLADMILAKKPGVFNVVVWDKLVEMGFSIDEILGIVDNLRVYAGRVRRVFRDLHALADHAESAFREVASFSHSLNGIYWREVAALARAAQQSAGGGR